MSPDPDGSKFIIFLLLFIASVLLCVVFAAGESAINNLNENSIKKDADSGNKKAERLLRIISGESTIISPLQFGLIFFGILSLTFLEIDVYCKTPVGEFAIWHFLFSAAVFLLFFFTFVDFLPKKLGRHYAKSFAYSMSGLLRFLSILSTPFLVIFSGIANLFLRIVKINPKVLDDTVTEEEIMMMVGEGEEKGVIGENEKDMIANIFDFNDTDAGETMTHRTDIIAVDEDDAIADVITLAVENGCSRVPVYREDIDTIIGICYIKDFLIYVGKDVPANLKITDVMRPAYFVPKSKKCSQLFTEMTEKKIQIAIVVDEYGGTAGLITLEDLIESIVGNIQDEYDNEDDEIKKMSETEFTVDGTTPVDEVSELTGVELPEGDYDTIAGLVMETLGRVPKEGETPSIKIGPLNIMVIEIEEQRISKLFISKDVSKSTESQK